MSALLYDAELWPLTATLTKRLDAAHHRWHRSILGISWKNRITHVEVRTRTGQQTMDNILRKRRICWLGHVLRMDHQRIPHQVLYWQVPGYKKGPGRPKANWRSTVNKDKRWGSPRKKQRWQLLTDTDGIGVWPNVSSWMRDEPRSNFKPR